MTQVLQWGILGTGNIAGQFAAGVVAGAKRSAVAAVASRTQQKADAFAQQHQVPAAHGSYEQLLNDPSVQAIYLALPNHLHHPWTLAALEAGKHVLCEKPVACSAAQAKEMFDAAGRCQRLLVEAFMYRSHPLTQAVRQVVASGAIGQVRMIRTSFCFRVRNTQSNVRFDPAMAGGGLMDVGCYCVDFTRLFAGTEPCSVHVAARLHEAGVDDVAAGTLLFPGGVVGSFVCGMSLQADNTAYICGDEGYIEIPVPWKPPVMGAEYALAHSTPPRMDKVRQAGPVREVFRVNADRPLYALEADAFAAAVLDGAPPAVSADDSLANMRILDELRQQAGLGY